MRYLSDALTRFADDKFVFLTGPRQSGKTTQAKAWLARHKGHYFNWDIAKDREAVRKLFSTNVAPAAHLVLDEVHKHPRWKRNLKGLYDGLHEAISVVVTGSARLDVYQRGGDSLLGRYEHLRLHPFTIGELVRSAGEVAPEPPADWLAVNVKSTAAPKIWERLRRFSGFPEPYTKANALHHQRWSLRRRELVLREDVRDLSQVKHIDLIEDLAALLPSRVGAPLSINGLREELQVAFDTVKAWLEILDRLYYCFRLKPYSKKIARSLTKETKLYLWDWTGIDEPGARFENMVASHLLKSVHYWRDLGYGEYDLSYFRDREKREVDFIITLRGAPVAAIECKLTDTQLSPGLIRFGEWFADVPRVQLVAVEGVHLRTKHGVVGTAADYLAGFV